MKALVTGATGFIGGHLAARLMTEGWQLKLLVRDRARLPAALAGAEIVQGDLANKEALRLAVQDVSVVFHCAANVKTWDSAEHYYTANVTGVENLLEAIRGTNPGLRLVHISTVDVYGFPVLPCDETGVTPPTGFGYGDSKREGEKRVREFCDVHGIAYAILRPANIIGPGSPFIERIGAELKAGLMLRIDGGRANAGMTYVDNLIDYMLWAAQDSKALSQCYNVRDSYDVSWAEFLSAFRKAIRGKGIIIGLPFAVAEAFARGFEAFYRLFLPSHEPLLHRLVVRIFGRTCGHSAEKIRSHSGMQSRVGFDKAMERSVIWFLKEKSI